MKPGRLLVELQNDADFETPALERFVEWIEAALGPDCVGEIAIRIVDEAESGALNARYRKGDGPTNVLSFAGDPALTAQIGEPPALGDLVICAPIVEREAREQGKSAAAHWAHLTVHGALHLVGFDHETQAEAERMERKEREILAALGFADPYS